MKTIIAILSLALTAGAQTATRIPSMGKETMTMTFPSWTATLPVSTWSHPGPTYYEVYFGQDKPFILPGRHLRSDTTDSFEQGYIAAIEESRILRGIESDEYQARYARVSCHGRQDPELPRLEWCKIYSRALLQWLADDAEFLVPYNPRTAMIEDGEEVNFPSHPITWEFIRAYGERDEPCAVYPNGKGMHEVCPHTEAAQP